MIRTATIIGGALVVIGVVGIGAGLVQGHGLQSISGDVSYDQTKSFPAGDIRNIKVNVDAAQVHILKGTSDQIKVHVHGDVAASNRGTDLDFQGSTSDQSLQVTVKHPWQHQSFFTLPFHSTGQLTVDVEVPAGNYENITAQVNAGKLALDGVDANELNLGDNAGAITVSNAHGRLEAHSNAGAVTVTNVVGGMNLQTNAGRISVQVDSITDDIQAKTNAGEVDVAVRQVPQNLQFHLKTDVGKVSVDLPNVQMTRSDRTAMDGGIGSGGPELDLQSDVGAVSLHQ